MSEQATSKAKNHTAPETATPPDDVPAAAAGNRELSDADLDKVAGGFAPSAAAAMRKAGKPPKDYA